jgi:hypothetical protein
MVITVRVLEGKSGTLPDIRTEWEACLSSAPEHQGLFTYEWYAVWVRDLGSAGPWTGETRLLLAYDDDRVLRGILPLARRHSFHVPFWCLPGYYQPVRGFVCHEAVSAAVCTAFAQTLLRIQGWNELYRFGPSDTAYPERAMLVKELSRRCRRVVLFHDDPTIITYDIPRSEEEFRKMVQEHSSMKRIRSYERRMERDGVAEVRHYCRPQGSELRDMLDACSTVERKSWLAASKTGYPRFMSRQNLQFWEHLCEEQLGPRGQLDVWLAYFNSQPIAFRFTVTAGSTRYLIANQYDEDFSQYRAGWILYLRDLENCVEHGVRSIDMGKGAAHYKTRWGGVMGPPGLDFLVFPPGPAGVLGARMIKLRPLYRRARIMIMS